MSFMSENLIENLKLSDINHPNYYDNYYISNGFSINWEGENGCIFGRF